MTTPKALRDQVEELICEHWTCMVSNSTTPECPAALPCDACETRASAIKLLRTPLAGGENGGDIERLKKHYPATWEQHIERPYLALVAELRAGYENVRDTCDDGFSLSVADLLRRAAAALASPPPIPTALEKALQEMPADRLGLLVEHFANGRLRAQFHRQRENDAGVDFVWSDRSGDLGVLLNIAMRAREALTSLDAALAGKTDAGGPNEATAERRVAQAIYESEPAPQEGVIADATTWENAHPVARMKCIQYARAALAAMPLARGRFADANRHIALEKARTFAVMVLAFLGRDRGSDRIDSTIVGLQKLANDSIADLDAALAGANNDENIKQARAFADQLINQPTWWEDEAVQSSPVGRAYREDLANTLLALAGAGAGKTE